ncbi:uncharacterized protein METZ01_LOCUS413214 [marine metagenome]|uniref:Uncharacterized protein n=1 Tax=marine metagenome TaxID=408172 RepID=A0A382WP54_9ZZZZ
MSIVPGSFRHKGHTVRFTLNTNGVIINEKFGDIEGSEKEMDINEATEYQQQLTEIGYGKEN